MLISSPMSRVRDVLAGGGATATAPRAPATRTAGDARLVGLDACAPSRRPLRATDFAIGSAGVVASAASPAGRAPPRARRRTPRPSRAAPPARRRSRRAGAAPSRRRGRASTRPASCAARARASSRGCARRPARRGGARRARRSASDGGPGSGCAPLQRGQRAEQPRVAHRAAADHHGVAAGLALHAQVGGDVLDVAVADDRDLARQRGAHGGDRLHARRRPRSPARACGRAR